MNILEELRLHSAALEDVVLHYPWAFSPIRTYVSRLRQLVSTSRGNASKGGFESVTKMIDEFYAAPRDSLWNTEVGESAPIVREIDRLVGELTELDDDSFKSLFAPEPKFRLVPAANIRRVPTPCIFVGHGRSKLWARLKLYLEDELGVKTITYESESRVGESIVPILEKMLDQATFAVLVLTAEDETAEGSRRARQNVVHEAGLFQGRLGFRKAVILKQHGLEDFTNVDGLQHIAFNEDDIEQTFYELQRVLKREGMLQK